MKKWNIKSSSSRPDATPDSRRPPKQAIGCMPRIFHFLSRHYPRPRINSPGRMGTIAMPHPESKSPAIATDGYSEESRTGGGPTRQGSVEAPRGLTLPLQIRRSGVFSYRGDVPRRSPALMEKLIGIEDPPSPVPDLVGSLPESVVEKRRELLEALEQCEEDLRALKRIIDVVRMAEIVRLENDRDIDGSDSLRFHWRGAQPRLRPQRRRFVISDTSSLCFSRI
ncbi:hypothetical protein HPP92_014340 [Vanilla planifolia]|uniref:Uncharacterized protein n=1 Tax=Vanilla planifolia TaxID=51239 RepID=A0A835QRQ3_VANPL|nr:hypothetical protein HPP92_014340 [Vanilla planifolia]